jgi:glucose/arabinose dehydrogenase
VIRVPLRNGRATGEYEDFVTGFVTADGRVWGRPVGVTVARDGALLVSETAATSSGASATPARGRLAGSKRLIENAKARFAFSIQR